MCSCSILLYSNGMKELSWQEIEAACNSLAAKIEASGFVADYIIGITSGGLIPLYFLSQELRIKNILLIDEIIDTGETFKQIKQRMEEKYGAHEARTAALVVRTDHCKHLPDFYAVEASDWAVFPWEKNSQ